MYIELTKLNKAQYIQHSKDKIILTMFSTYCYNSNRLAITY